MSSEDDELEDISPHIRIRIDPRKKEWLEYADEHHHGNLTDLIKDAVDNTIDGNWVLEDKHQANTEIDTSGLEEGISEVNDRLSVVEKQLNDLSLQSNQESDISASRDEILKLANKCHDLLPHLQSEIQFPTLSKSISVDLSNIPKKYLQEDDESSDAYSEERIRAKVTGRAEDISNALEEPVSHVRQALIFLEQSETGSMIKSTIEEGERRWFVHDDELSPVMYYLRKDKISDSVNLYEGN